MRTDPHSYADLDQGRTTHLQLVLDVRLDERVLAGHATPKFDDAHAGPALRRASAARLAGASGLLRIHGRG